MSYLTANPTPRSAMMRLSGSTPNQSQLNNNNNDNTIADINELNYLVNMTENEQNTLQNENLEIESLLTIEINRFQHEKDNYGEMVQKKTLLKDLGSKISDSIELTMAKLEQILISLNRNDQIRVYIDCIDSFLHQKSLLLNRIDELRCEIDSLSSAVETLENATSPQFITEINQLHLDYQQKKSILGNLHIEISSHRPEKARLLDQEASCKQALEDLDKQIFSLETSILAKKQEIVRLNEEIEKVREQQRLSLDEMGNMENSLILQRSEKQIEIEKILGEIASILTNLVKVNELLHMVIQQRADILEEIQQLRLEHDKLKFDQNQIDDKIRQTEGDIRSTEAMKAVTESAISAQQRITESYKEQSRFIIDSRRPLEQESAQMSISIEETKSLIEKLEEQQNSLCTYPPLIPIISRITELTEKKSLLLNEVTKNQERIRELKLSLSSTSTQELTLSKTRDNLKEGNLCLRETNSSTEMEIVEIEVVSFDQQSELELKKRGIFDLEDELKVKTIGLEKKKEEAAELEAELLSSRYKNEVYHEKILAAQIVGEVEKRGEKKREVLRSRNAHEILQMQNKIQEQDQVFRMEVKKSNDQYLREKSSLEAEIDKLKSADRSL